MKLRSLGDCFGKAVSYRLGRGRREASGCSPGCQDYAPEASERSKCLGVALETIVLLSGKNV